MPCWNPTTKILAIPLSEEQLKGVLKKYSDGDGKLSRKELESALKSLGLPVRFSGWRPRCADGHADRNGDGVISEEEMGELVKYAASKWGFTIA